MMYYFQFMSEKIGGAKGTELDEEFIEMERVCRTQSSKQPTCVIEICVTGLYKNSGSDNNLDEAEPVNHF